MIQPLEYNFLKQIETSHPSYRASYKQSYSADDVYSLLVVFPLDIISFDDAI